MLTEIIIRTLISVINQFTKNDLNAYIEKFPKEIGEKIGEAIKGNIAPLKSWLQENSGNIKILTSELFKKNTTTEIAVIDNKISEMETIVKVILNDIELLKKPILVKEFFGNTKYFSLWILNGYFDNSYSLEKSKINFNYQFEVYLFENESKQYNRLYKSIKQNKLITKKQLKRGIKVQSITPLDVIVENKHLIGKMLKKWKKIPLNFSVSSYLNMLAEIDEFNSLMSSKTSLWDKVKNLFS